MRDPRWLHRHQRHRVQSRPGGRREPSRNSSTSTRITGAARDRGRPRRPRRQGHARRRASPATAGAAMRSRRPMPRASRASTSCRTRCRRQRGDVQARLHPFEADAFDFSTTPGFTRAEQEAAIKTINKMVLCTYPLPVAVGFPEDACRRPREPERVAGIGRGSLKAAYGGDGLPNADVRRHLRAAVLGRGRAVDALPGGDRARVPRVPPACAAPGAQSDIDFDDASRNSGLRRPHQGARDRSRQHAAREDRLRRVLRRRARPELLADLPGGPGLRRARRHRRRPAARPPGRRSRAGSRDPARGPPAFRGRKPVRQRATRGRSSRGPTGRLPRRARR